MGRFGRLGVGLQGCNGLRARSRVVGEQQAVTVEVARECRGFEDWSSMVEEECEDSNVQAYGG